MSAIGSRGGGHSSRPPSRNSRRIAKSWGGKSEPRTARSPAELIARSEAHREEIARCLAAWEKPMERAQRAVNVVGLLKRHAPKVMGIAAGLAALWAVRGRAPVAPGITGPQVPGEPLRLGGVLDRAE